MATLFYLVQISHIVLTSGTKVTVFVEQINKEYKLACKKNTLSCAGWQKM